MSRGSSSRRTDWPTANFSVVIGSLTKAPARARRRAGPSRSRAPGWAGGSGTSAPRGWRRRPPARRISSSTRRVDGLRRVDVDRGHAGPVAAQRGSRSCMMAITKRAFSRIAVRRGVAVAHDALRALRAVAQLARPGHDEGRRGRVAGHGVGEGVERGLGRRGRHRGHVGAGDRVVLADQDAPLGQEPAIALVELREAVEGEGLRAPKLDPAQRRPRPASRAVPLDPREAGAPRQPARRASRARSRGRPMATVPHENALMPGRYW